MCSTSYPTQICAYRQCCTHFAKSSDKRRLQHSVSALLFQDFNRAVVMPLEEFGRPLYSSAKHSDLVTQCRFPWGKNVLPRIMAFALIFMLRFLGTFTLIFVGTEVGRN